MPSIDLTRAATLKIADHPYPIITSYELGLALFQLVTGGSIGGQELRLQKKVPEPRHYREVLKFFRAYGVLRDIQGVPPGTVFSVLGKDDATPAENIVCRVDPFAYLSHLSAMEFYGLTDRISKTVYASSPKPKEWKSFAEGKMHKDLGQDFLTYVETGLPTLNRVRMRTIRQRTIEIFRREHLGAFRTIRTTGVRISTIGRTFLDMLREPDLCGGIRHVLSVYKEKSKEFASLIVDDVDAHGSQIDKVRTGYVLTEIVGIEDPRVEGWKQFAQRGGSRKLYAKGEYSSNFSEDWCLSINVE